jgi:hypothetical protein
METGVDLEDKSPIFALLHVGTVSGTSLSLDVKQQESARDPVLIADVGKVS